MQCGSLTWNSFGKSRTGFLSICWEASINILNCLLFDLMNTYILSSVSSLLARNQVRFPVASKLNSELNQTWSFSH